MLRAAVAWVLLAIAWGCALLAGAWANTPFAMIFVAAPLWLLALAAWGGALAGLRVVDKSGTHWVVALSGGVLVLVTVVGWSATMGGVLLQMRRELYLQTLRNLDPGFDALMGRAWPGLLAWMVPWLLGLSFAGHGVRMRAGIAWGTILFWALVYTAILFLIPLLLLYWDVPLSA